MTRPRKQERSVVDVVNGLTDWQLVAVKWRDAHSPHSGWHEVDDYQAEDAVAVTVGRVWKNCHPEYLTTAGTVFVTDEKPKTVGDINHIPFGMILEITPLQGVPNG